MARLPAPAIASMLRDPLWPVAHWCALVSALLVALALLLLMDRRESAAMVVGVRLGVVATVFMAIEFAVELAAQADVMRFASGESVVMVSLIDVMQAVGFPSLALAFILIATGTRWTPRWVVALGPVFLVGNLLPVWMVWAGLHLARQGDSVMPR